MNEDSYRHDIVPPHNDLLEREICCAAFALDGGRRSELVLKMEPEFFHDAYYRELYLCAVEDNDPPSVAYDKVWTRMSSLKGIIPREAFIAWCTSNPMFGQRYNPAKAIGQLRELWMRRVAIEEARKMLFEASRGNIDLNAYNEKLCKVAASEKAAYNDRAIESLDRILYIAEHGPDLSEMEAFSFKNIDLMMRGLKRTDFVVLGGAPNTGKSPFAYNCIINRAKAGYGDQMLISMEMSKEQVIQELVSIYTKIYFDDITHGLRPAYKDEALKTIRDAVEWINERIYIIDSTIGTISPNLIRALINQKVCELTAKGRKLDMISLDYLQLVGNGMEGIKEWTRFIKDHALKTQIPWLVISSLSRQYDRRVLTAAEDCPFVVPTMSDLRESGEIEFDATKIWFLLHRLSGGMPVKDKRIMYLSKNKFGPKDCYQEMDFDFKTMSFYEREDRNTQATSSGEFSDNKTVIGMV